MKEKTKGFLMMLPFIALAIFGIWCLRDKYIHASKDDINLFIKCMCSVLKIFCISLVSWACVMLFVFGISKVCKK